MAFIQRLKELGIHADIAKKIWYEYLTPFDRWMVYAAHKYKTNADGEVFAIFDNLEESKFQKLIYQVAISGYLEIIKGIVATADKWPNYKYHDICETAANYNHLDIIKWAFSNGYTGNSHLLGRAAFSGHLEVMKWLHDNVSNLIFDSPYSWVINGIASISKKIEILQWLLNHNYPKNANMNELSDAVLKGSKELIQWLWDHNFQSKDDLCADAACIGNIELIQWLQERNYICDEEACDEAAYYGHLETLQWLRQNGCPWDDRVTANACDNGDLQMFKWAIENGCPYNRDDIYTYYTNDNPIRKYLIENGL